MLPLNFTFSHNTFWPMGPLSPFPHGPIIPLLPSPHFFTQIFANESSKMAWWCLSVWIDEKKCSPHFFTQIFANESSKMTWWRLSIWIDEKKMKRLQVSSILQIQSYSNSKLDNFVILSFPYIWQTKMQPWKFLLSQLSHNTFQVNVYKVARLKRTLDMVLSAFRLHDVNLFFNMHSTTWLHFSYNW